MNITPQKGSKYSKVVGPLFQGFAFNEEHSCLKIGHFYIPKMPGRSFLRSLGSLHTCRGSRSFSPHGQARGHISGAQCGGVELP